MSDQNNNNGPVNEDTDTVVNETSNTEAYNDAEAGQEPLSIKSRSEKPFTFKKLMKIVASSILAVNFAYAGIADLLDNKSENNRNFFQHSGDLTMKFVNAAKGKKDTSTHFLYCQPEYAVSAQTQEEADQRAALQNERAQQVDDLVSNKSSVAYRLAKTGAHVTLFAESANGNVNVVGSEKAAGQHCPAGYAGTTIPRLDKK
jgi:hypothetical protein